jgi:hypothetical protein
VLSIDAPLSLQVPPDPPQAALLAGVAAGRFTAIDDLTETTDIERESSPR